MRRGKAVLDDPEFSLSGQRRRRQTGVTVRCGEALSQIVGVNKNRGTYLFAVSTIILPEYEALDRLRGEIAITRQITGWAIQDAPSGADMTTLQGFDGRLQAFDRTVFAIQYRGDPSAVYSGPWFPPHPAGPFEQDLQATQGELCAAHAALANAVAALTSKTGRQTLEQQGVVFDDLAQAVNRMGAR